MARLRLDDPYREIVHLQCRVAELRHVIFEAISELIAHPDETERARDILSAPFVSKDK